MRQNDSDIKSCVYACGTNVFTCMVMHVHEHKRTVERKRGVQGHKASNWKVVGWEWAKALARDRSSLAS